METTDRAMNYAVANRIAEARSETASVRKELEASRQQIADLQREIARLKRAGEKRAGTQQAGVVKQLPRECLIHE
jgi:phage host-nuclease inhibitor protein Gam